MKERNSRNLKYKMCKLCEINPVYEFTNKRKVCKNCFMQYFQKKIFYTIRKFELIKPSEKILFVNKNTLQDAVLEDILNNFSKKLGIEITKSRAKNVKKQIISSTIDSEAEKIIYELINGDAKNLENLTPKTRIKNTTIIKPLYLFLDKEILIYAKIKGIETQNNQEKKDKTSLFIEEMEKKHPELKRAIVNSYLKLYTKN